MPRDRTGEDPEWLRKQLELNEIGRILLDANDKLRGNTEAIAEAHRSVQLAFDRVEKVLNSVGSILGPEPFGGAEKVTPLMETQALIAGAQSLLVGLLRKGVRPVEAYGDLLFASHLLVQAERAMRTILLSRGHSGN